MSSVQRRSNKGMKVIRIRVHFPALVGRHIPKDVVIRTSAHTVKKVLEEFYQKIGINYEKYNKQTKEIENIFSGRVLIKNGKIAGRFAINGYVSEDNHEQIIRSGDEIHILFLISGG